MKIAIKHFLTKQNINEDLFYSSLISELEEIVEEELSKDIEEINEGLIDDCCIAIENIQNALQGGIIEKYEAVSGVERIIKQYNRKIRSVYVALVACAAVAVLCAVTSVKLTSQNAQGSLKPNSFLGDDFNDYELTVANLETTEKEQPTKVQEDEPTTFTNSTTTVAPSTRENQVTEEFTPPSTMPVPHIYKLEVLIPPGGGLEYADVSQIDLNGVFVKVYYTGNIEKVVPIAECDVEIGTPDENGKTKITITYNHMYTSIYVNIRAEKGKTSE